MLPATDGDDALHNERFRFGEFEFDAESGELRGTNSRDDAPLKRLPPQPARLLALLLEKRGEIVTREEIRKQIWPGVEIEFDTSLHFCIRQIRSALGDSADRPRYVETLPRRGYRFLPAVEPDRPSAEPESAVRPAIPGRWRLAAALLIVTGGTAAVLLSGGGSGAPANSPLRIAVMPFRPPADSVFGQVPAIAEWVLQDLTLAVGERAEIGGPTTTSSYTDSGDALRRLALEYELDYIVNGRFLNDERGTRMLAELIRASDGAHTWVEVYQELDDGRRIGEEISRNVIRELRLAGSDP
jgi:DNA-binding winged helix-turn-helix (wHTH) protein/TolB-like protein